MLDLLLLVAAAEASAAELICVKCVLVVTVRLAFAQVWYRLPFYLWPPCVCTVSSTTAKYSFGGFAPLKGAIYAFEWIFLQ